MEVWEEADAARRKRGSQRRCRRDGLPLFLRGLVLSQLTRPQPSPRQSPPNAVPPSSSTPNFRFQQLWREDGRDRVPRESCPLLPKQLQWGRRKQLGSHSFSCCPAGRGGGRKKKAYSVSPARFSAAGDLSSKTRKRRRCHCRFEQFTFILWAEKGRTACRNGGTFFSFLTGWLGRRRLALYQQPFSPLPSFPSPRAGILISQ